MGDIVRSHYNARPDQGHQGRQQSPIISLRSLNNFIKSRLITNFTPRNASVCDIACGKGGDLLKWKSARIRKLLGLDIADVSITQASKRYEKGRFQFNARFKALDCFTVYCFY
jgi:mRNA (guanine-N7-)-methyltransferase